MDLRWCWPWFSYLILAPSSTSTNIIYYKCKYTCKANGPNYLEIVLRTLSNTLIVEKLVSRTTSSSNRSSSHLKRNSTSKNNQSCIITLMWLWEITINKIMVVKIMKCDQYSGCFPIYHKHIPENILFILSFSCPMKSRIFWPHRKWNPSVIENISTQSSSTRTLGHNVSDGQCPIASTMPF